MSKGDVKSDKLIPNLKIIPNQVCFKNYQAGNEYKEKIRVINQDVKLLIITIKFDNPENIKLAIPENRSKIYLESNTTIELELSFFPHLNPKKEPIDRRYEINLNIINASTKLHIPVLVLSANPTINFPREIQLPDTAINDPSYSNIFVLNYSSRSYKFSIDTKNEVKIHPECKVIAMKPGIGLTFMIEFIPRTLNDFHEKICICFENDKRMTILLKCKVLPVNVFFIDEIIEFSSTYIGMRDEKSIEIVNNGENSTHFEWDYDINRDNEEQSLFRYLEINPMNGNLEPHTITKIDLIFKPEDTNDDDIEILKEIFITLGLKLSICHNYKPSINVKGKVFGPSFELDCKIVNIDEVFVGEMRSIKVNLRNTGVISGKVFIEKIQSPNDGIVKVSPKYEVLNEGEVKKFKIKFMARKIGLFLDQAVFKIKNGDSIKFTIQGLIKPLQIVKEPSTLNFYASPICVPKMKFLKLTNEHPFDVDVTIEIENNGIDDPLEFLEFYKSNNSSISKSSSFETVDSHQQESSSSLLSQASIKSFMEHSGLAMDVIESHIAEIFNKVDEYMEHKEIVSSILDDELCNEFEKREVVEMLVDMLIEKVTLSVDFVKFNEKNWVLPLHPREVICNKEHITIRPKSCQELKVFMSPNCVGKLTKNLRLHMTVSNASKKYPVEETIVSIPIVIDCHAADIIIHNPINEICSYAESETALAIHIENLSNIDGFFAVPKISDCEIEVTCQDEKFHVNGSATKIINLIIIPLVSGQIVKYINIVALGSSKTFPIKIECKSLPPDIIVKPKKIFVNDMDVLKKDDTRIFIENRSTTKARFFIKLEHDNQCFNINPRGGILSSKQCILVLLEKFFYDPGDYHDILIVEIVNGQVIKIPIKCTVRKLPIIIEPSFTNVIDFGTLFTSKNSPFLDYKFTNAGKISYMIFIILKNWKNRKEISYTIEPKRFELSPNCSQVVRFSLNALYASSSVDEITIEGCSIHSPIRELIWESKMKANVIKPTINFTANELIFNCFYGQEDDLIEQVEITNNSVLPLQMVLKIDGNFFFYISRVNSFKQIVKLNLDPKQTRPVNIHFHSNILKSHKKATTIKEKLKVCALGDLQAVINLTAHLIYPAIELSSDALNIIANNHPCSSHFVLSNPSDRLIASLEIKFRDNSTIITSIHEKRRENLMKIMQCLIKHKCNLSEIFFMDYSTEDDETLQSIDSETTKLNDEDQSQGNSEELDSIKNDTKKDFMQYFKEMTQVASEAELNEERDECLISLDQTQRVLKPNESCLIPIQFHGSKEAFHYSSTISCQVAGGSCYDIRLNLINCNPNVLITRTHFEMTKSWQEILINNLRIYSINPILNVIKIVTREKVSLVDELINGCVKMSTKTSSKFVLDGDERLCKELKFSVFTGCLPVFRTQFEIQVSDKPAIPITFVGKNSMPSITPLDVDRRSLYDMNKAFEYESLCEIFKEVDQINVQEELISPEDISKAKLKIAELEAKNNKKSNRKRRTSTKQEAIDDFETGDSSDLMPKEFLLSLAENGRSLWCEKQKKTFSGKMLQIVDEELDALGFLALDYPNEYPQSHEIINFIAQYGFARSLGSDEIFSAYKKIYDRHVVDKFRHAQKCIGHRQGFCDDSIAPLPLVLPEYRIDFGTINIDEVFEETLRIFIHNDCASIAIRTEAIIPGFQIELSINNELNEMFNVTNHLKEQSNEKYINRTTRLASDNPFSVKRCHSFDFIEGKVHSREISRDKNRIDEINQVYNEKMSTKIKQDEKSQFTLMEIFQKIPFKSDLRIIEFKITFNPKAENYVDEALFDEILYFDLHLGPQIPIHITANITQPDTEFFE